MLPMWPGQFASNSIYEYLGPMCKMKLVNGYSPCGPQIHNELYAKLQSFHRNSYKHLKTLNIKYVMLYRRYLDENYENFCNTIDSFQDKGVKIYKMLEKNSEACVFNIIGNSNTIF